MSAFLNQQLTNVGWDALSTALGGGRLTFFKMQAGSGTIANDAAIMGMTHLVTPVCDIGITKYTIEGDGQITLFGNIASAQLDLGFTFRELGVFATIEAPVVGSGGVPTGPNITPFTVAPSTTANPVVPNPPVGTPLMYSYCNSYANSDYIPGKGETTDVVNTVQVTIKIDQAQNVVINITAGQQLSIENIGPPSVGAGPWSYTQANVAYMKRLVQGPAMVITEDTNTITIGQRQLTADLDLYVANGNPDISPNFSTIQNAINYLGQYLIPTTIKARINVMPGYYTGNVYMDHPNNPSITIQGPQNPSVSLTGIASITGSANNWSVRFNVPSTANMAVNSWVLIDSLTQNPTLYNSHLLAGFYKITAVVANSSVTVLVPYRKASFSVTGVTSGSITPITAIINPVLNGYVYFNTGIGLFQYLGVVAQVPPTLSSCGITAGSGLSKLNCVGVAGYNTIANANSTNLVHGFGTSGILRCVRCNSTNNQNGFASWGGGHFDFEYCNSTHNNRLGFWFDGGSSANIANGKTASEGNANYGCLTANSSTVSIIPSVVPSTFVCSYNENFGITLVGKGELVIGGPTSYYEAVNNTAGDVQVDVFGLLYGSAQVSGTRVFNLTPNLLSSRGALIV